MKLSGSQLRGTLQMLCGSQFTLKLPSKWLKPIQEVPLALKRFITNAPQLFSIIVEQLKRSYQMHHEPLFPPGLHEVSESDLENHFLKAFSASQTRAELISGLRAFIASLKRAGIVFEVWLDGSFCTQKLNPNDIDLVVFADENEVNRLSPAEQQYLRMLFEDRQGARVKYGCDVFFAPTGNFNMRSYWRGWFGFDRNENPKGMAKLMVTP